MAQNLHLPQESSCAMVHCHRLSLIAEPSDGILLTIIENMLAGTYA